MPSKCSLSRINLAKDLLTFARTEAKEGYTTNNDIRIRDSAEKAYLAAVEATDFLMECHGRSPGVGPEAHDVRHRFLQEIGRRDLEKDYSYYTDTLHGTCFYRGVCPTRDSMETILQEIQQYIDKVQA